MTRKQQSKRILSITVKQMIDDSPDTSWLGEYSNSPANEFAIDRKHSEDCQINNLNREALAQVERVHNYITALTYYTLTSETELEALRDAQDILIEAQDALQECNCDGGDMCSREYRYFNASFNYVDKHGKPTDGLTPENVRKYVRQDYERMERLNRGDWAFIGIEAEAQVLIAGHAVQRITSGGLWGIESDSDLQEVEQEQLSELKDQLRAIGFSTRAIAAAMREVERKRRIIYPQQF